MSISQHEAVQLINHTIFRPGWRFDALPMRGDGGMVMIGVEIETVDTSFVTRGGEYRVPLTERAVFLAKASEYPNAEALLFRLLAFIREELTQHEDREFLRTWDSAAERWVAPFHSHTHNGVRAWDRHQLAMLPKVERLTLGSSGPWKNVVLDNGTRSADDPCNQIDDGSGPCSEHSVRAVVCDQEDDMGDCWESGNSKVVNVAPCNDQTDDDDDIDGPQRLNSESDCTLGPPERRPVLVSTSASDPCTEDHGGCAEWGKKG